MAVYEINGANIMNDANKIDDYISKVFKETGRAVLFNQDKSKWQHRIFNLTVAEIVDKFGIELQESIHIVQRYFVSNGLNVKSKTYYSHNLYDYPIKE